MSKMIKYNFMWLVTIFISSNKTWNFKNHKVTLIMDESLFVTVPYIITLQFGHNDRCHYLVTNLLMIIILYHIIKDVYVMGYRHNQLINQVLESFIHFLLLHWIPSNIIKKCISNYSLLYGYVLTKSQDYVHTSDGKM